MKTINKPDVYAPLTPSDSIKEKKVYSFLESISAEYHGGVTSLGLRHGGNNGGCGLRAKQMEQKLALRTLTLIKGGLGTSISKSTIELVEDGRNHERNKCRDLIRIEGSISNRKRKRSRQSLCKLVDNRDASLAQPDRDKYYTEILFGLNDIWNTYISELLKPSLKLFDNKTIATLLSRAELVGASIRVARSKSTTYAGQRGFIVDSSVNVWRIVTTTKNGNDDEINRDSAPFKWKLINLPKKGSDIILYIPGFKSNGEHMQIMVSSFEV